jgi:cell division protein FtsW
MYALVALGVVMTYSASAVYADQFFNSPTYFLRRQFFYVTIGSILFWFVSSLDPDFLRQHSRFLMILAVLLLLAVFLPFLGHTAGGARRWIKLPFITFQPVEYAKLALCIYLSDYLSRKRQRITKGSLSVFYTPLGLVSLIFILVIAQPDLGSCVFLFILMAVLFFLSGIRMRYILIAVFAALCVVSLLIWQAPYRMSRITAFLDPWKDPKGSGFQIIQSFIAFGLGGIKGVGLGESTQKLFYLPQSHTDFIFSIIAEELGLIGALCVVGLFALFFFFGNRLAQRCRDPFLRLLAFSLVVFITLQALINFLVTVGLIPTKGLPLPFVSYGGTALIFHMVSIGILVAIDKRSVRHSSR